MQRSTTPQIHAPFPVPRPSHTAMGLPSPSPAAVSGGVTAPRLESGSHRRAAARGRWGAAREKTRPPGPGDPDSGDGAAAARLRGTTARCRDDSALSAAGLARPAVTARHGVTAPTCLCVCPALAAARAGGDGGGPRAVDTFHWPGQRPRLPLRRSRGGGVELARSLTVQAAVTGHGPGHGGSPPVTARSRAAAARRWSARTALRSGTGGGGGSGPIGGWQSTDAG